MTTKMKKLDAIRRIQKQIIEIETVLTKGRKDPYLNRWRAETLTTLKYIFGENHTNVSLFEQVEYQARVLFAGMSEDYYKSFFESQLPIAKSVLESMITEISEFWEDDTIEIQTKGKIMNHKIPKSKAIEVLNQKISTIETIRSKGSDDSSFKKWEADTILILENLFGENSKEINIFKKIQYSSITLLDSEDSEWINYFNDALNEAKAVLEAILNSVELFWPDESLPQTPPKPETKTPPTQEAIMTPKKPSLFIGSSVEGLPVAKAIQVNLDHFAEVTIWSQGVFGPSGGTLETLVNEAPMYDFAVLVLTPDDIVTKREQTKNAPRDNVIFELGLFIGILGRSRTFMVIPRNMNIDLPTDLAGITPATYEAASSNKIAALGAASTALEREIIRQGRRKP